MNNQNRTETRNASLDVLRVICITLIILGHACMQSDIGKMTFQDSKSCYLLSLFLGNSLRFSINCFVMITGWFLCDKEYKFQRFLFTWLMTFIINTTVTVVLVVLKKVPLISFYNAQAFLPIIGRPQWYMCEYMLLLLLIPPLNSMIRFLPKKGLLYIIGVMFFFITGVSTFVPLDYTPPFFSELMWFIFLYLFIAFEKNNKTRILNNKLVDIILFILGWGIITVLYYYSSKESVINRFYLYYMSHYEALPCFMASVGLFYFLKNVKVKSNRLISLLGISTGVIYIVHQVPILWRYDFFTFWNGVFNVNKYVHSKFVLFYLIGILICLYSFGILFYILFNKFFSLFMRNGKVSELVFKINAFFNTTFRLNEKDVLNDN